MKFVKFILTIAVVVGLTGISGAAPIINTTDTLADGTSYGWWTNSGDLLGIISGNNNKMEAVESLIEGFKGWDPTSFELTTTTVSSTNYDASGYQITGASNTGTWNATPAGNTIGFYVVKAGNHYALYEVFPAEGDGSWSTYDLWEYGQDNNIKGLGGKGGLEISHFTGYNPVPVPSAILLLGTGLLGLVGIGRRKRLNKKA